MGFLDHSTNNIIIDAVLTDLGRQFLSRNDGSFSIVKFALADDEVDYSIIEKLGRTVGKEKIEKNTPIFEAITSQNLALKNRMVSISNPTLTKLPSLALTGPDSNSQVSLTRSTVATTTTSNQESIIIKQSQSGGASIPADLSDSAFIITCNNLFLTISGKVPESVDADNIATYLIVKDPATLPGVKSQGSFVIQAKNVSTDVFNAYGDDSEVRMPVTISGVASGASITFTTVIT